MNYFLVDYENVGCKSLKCLVKCLKDSDQLYVFYSKQCPNIALDMVADITKRGCIFKTHKATNGTKNALDFQLSSYIGFLIGKATKKDKFYIVSNDTGYDCLSSYWSSQGHFLARIPLANNQTKDVKLP